MGGDGLAETYFPCPWKVKDWYSRSLRALEGSFLVQKRGFKRKDVPFLKLLSIVSDGYFGPTPIRPSFQYLTRPLCRVFS